MTAKIIQLRDFRRKEEKTAATLEQMATEMTEQFNQRAEEGTVVECIPYGGAGIDGMIYESSLGYVAPADDPA